MPHLRVSIAPMGLAIAAATFGNTTALATNAADVREKHAAVAMGVTFGVLFHELGHAMIGELELPATGPEEDTADEFSALMMSEMARGETDPLLIDIATYSVLLWHYHARQRVGEPQAVWGEHSSDIRRFRHMFCMLYGADPALFGGLANRLEVDQHFKSRCLEDYKKRKRAWEAIFESKARNLGPDSPGHHPANTPGGRIRVQVLPTSNPYGPFVAAVFHSPEWDEMRVMLSDYLVWPRDLSIEFKDCGVANAFYKPGAGAIAMCYELIEHFSQLVMQGEGLAVTAAPRNSALTFLQGTWSTRLNTSHGLLDVAITFAEDGSYRNDEVWAQTGGLAARIAGAWSARPAAEDQLLISRSPAEWLPQEFCYYDQAACQPQASETASYARIIDQNTVEMDGAVWQRSR